MQKRYHKLLFSIIVLVILPWALLHCAAHNQKSDSGRTPKSLGMKPGIEIGNVLAIEVKGEDDCTGDFIIKEDGHIDFCYVGRIQVEGMDQKEVQKKITSILEQSYIKNPKVKVLLDSGSGTGRTLGSVKVLGEVHQPGTYTMKPGYTVLDLILDAGGFTDFASPNKTRLVRGQGRDKIVRTVRMKEIMKTGDREKDEVLKPGDVVVVPEGLL